jgi:hypothetical protein
MVTHHLNFGSGIAVGLIANTMLEFRYNRLPLSALPVDASPAVTGIAILTPPTPAELGWAGDKKMRGPRYELHQ